MSTVLQQFCLFLEVLDFINEVFSITDDLGLLDKCGKMMMDDGTNWHAGTDLYMWVFCNLYAPGFHLVFSSPAHLEMAVIYPLLSLS
jgi:hypothetical protein